VGVKSQEVTGTVLHDGGMPVVLGVVFGVNLIRMSPLLPGVTAGVHHDGMPFAHDQPIVE
jgi:hypothetical protein